MLSLLIGRMKFLYPKLLIAIFGVMAGAEFWGHA